MDKKKFVLNLCLTVCGFSVFIILSVLSGPNDFGAFAFFFVWGMIMIFAGVIGMLSTFFLEGIEYGS